jgi:hypothetical protein
MALLTQVTATSSYVDIVLPAMLVLGLGLGLIFAQTINTAAPRRCGGTQPARGCGGGPAAGGARAHATDLIGAESARAV